MSTIKSSAENLTLNADGSGNDIIFQSNASNVATLDQAGLLTATTFAGSGASLTALNATNLGSGTVPTARLGSGTASSSTILYGDQTYKTAPSSGISDLSPYFMGHTAGTQVPSSGVTTKVSFGEVEDSDSAYASDRFTVPSGEGGRYFLAAGMTLYSNASNRVTDSVIYLYKNGSQVSVQPAGGQYSANPGANTVSTALVTILNLAAADYIEVYAYSTTNSGAVSFGARTFSGFKIGA